MAELRLWRDGGGQGEVEEVVVDCRQVHACVRGVGEGEVYAGGGGRAGVCVCGGGGGRDQLR